MFFFLGNCRPVFRYQSKSFSYCLSFFMFSLYLGVENKVKGKEFSATDEIYLPADGEEKIEEPALKRSREC